MRDLSKFNIPKNPAANKVEIEEKAKNSKKKILVIAAVVVLLTVAVASKIINKHLKKQKSEEAEIAEMVSNDNKALSTDLDADEFSTDSNKTPYDEDDTKISENPDTMTFTFYNNLKNETVVVDAVPTSERSQYKYTYMFQIASFRNMDETKYYTQKLDSVGLKPTFEKVGSWIRMSIGPYDSARAMAPDIIKLQKVGINMGFTREIDKVRIEPLADKTDKTDKNA
jgi:cell division protein FtsN